MSLSFSALRSVCRASRLCHRPEQSRAIGQARRGGVQYVERAFSAVSSGNLSRPAGSSALVHRSRGPAYSRNHPKTPSRRSNKSSLLGPVKGPRFDSWATPTVHDDHHVKFEALYSVLTLCGKASHGPRRQSARTHRSSSKPTPKTAGASDRLHRLSPRARGLRQARPGAYGAPSQETSNNIGRFMAAPQLVFPGCQAPTGEKLMRLAQVRPCSTWKPLASERSLRSHQCARIPRMLWPSDPTTTNRRARLNAPGSAQRKFLS